MVHQAILPGVHIFLTEVSTSHLDYSISMVLSWLLLFSFFGGPLPLLISGGDLLAFGSHDLEFFSPL